MRSIKKKDDVGIPDKLDPKQVIIASQIIMKRITKKMVVKKKNKSPSYQPIVDFGFYYSMSTNVYKKKYIDAVINLKNCRKCGCLITEAVNDLAIVMTFMKAEESRLKKMKKCQTFYDNIPIIPCKVIETLPERIEMDHVIVNLKVQKKSKNVKVKMTTPLLDLYEKYLSLIHI